MMGKWKPGAELSARKLLMEAGWGQWDLSALTPDTGRLFQVRHLASGDSQHLAWVHEASGVQCGLELPHCLHAHITHLLLQQLPLTQPYAMLPSTCPVECQRPPAQLFCKSLYPAELLRIFRVYQQQAVEIAVAHVPNNGSCDPRGHQVLLGLHHDLRQPGEGDTHVC